MGRQRGLLRSGDECSPCALRRCRLCPHRQSSRAPHGEHVPHPLRTLRQLWQQPQAEAAPLWSWLTDAASSIRSGGTTTPGTVEFGESQARLSHVERPERVCGSVLWGHKHSLLSSVQLFLSACEHASSSAQVEEQRHFSLVAAASNREMALPG